MPLYQSLSDLPPAHVEAQWAGFIARLKAAPELQFVTEILNKDNTAMVAENSPRITVVNVLDDWQRDTLGANAAWSCWHSYGVRFYIYNNGSKEPGNDTDQRMLEMRRGNDVLLEVLRSATFARYPGYWYELRLLDKTTAYHQIGERCFATTRLQLRARYGPGETTVNSRDLRLNRRAQAARTVAEAHIVPIQAQLSGND